MLIEFLGHSCFAIDHTLVTDPYHTGLGFEMPRVKASIVTLSHNHFDHNNAEGVAGHPTVLQGDVDCTLAGMKIRSIACYHDEVRGAKRGINHIFVISTPQATLCHMGDIGQPYTAALGQAIGHIDVLFIPVGGTYTIDAVGAKAYVDALQPTYIVPMHYKTPSCTLDVDTVDKFVAMFGAGDVRRIAGNSVELTRFSGSPQVLLFA